MDDTARLIVIVLLAAFAIERVTAAIGYILEAARLSTIDHPAARKLRQKQRRKLLLLSIAGTFALAVVFLADLRILRVLGLSASAPPAVDFWMTWLVLFAGADRVRDFLEDGGAAPARSETPAVRIEVDRDADVREIARAS